jgi:hypothetical protein
VEMALREWLRMQQPDFCCKGILKLLPTWHKSIIVLCGMLQNNDTSAVWMSCS